MGFLVPVDRIRCKVSRNAFKLKIGQLLSEIWPLQCGSLYIILYWIISYFLRDYSAYFGLRFTNKTGHDKIRKVNLPGGQVDLKIYLPPSECYLPTHWSLLAPQYQPLVWWSNHQKKTSNRTYKPIACGLFTFGSSIQVHICWNSMCWLQISITNENWVLISSHYYNNQHISWLCHNENCVEDNIFLGDFVYQAVNVGILVSIHYNTVKSV